MPAKTFRIIRGSLLAIFAAGCAVAAAPGGRSRSIVGTWELISYEAAAGGVANLPLGENPVGLIVYDRNGNVAAQLMRRDHQTYQPVAPARPGGTAVTAGYIAYFGNYSVDWTQSVVTHTITAALSATDVGRTLKRRIRFEGEVLVLEVGEGADVRVLKWRRVAS